MQVELEQPCPCLGTIYSLCSVYYPNIRYRSDVLKRWNFLKTGFYEGIKLAVLLRERGWQVSTSMVGRILSYLKARGVLKE